MLVTFAVSIDDTPGVLNRVAALLHRRAVDIASLAVGPTERAGVSRMTIVVDTDVAGSRRIAAHLDKLLDVVRVELIPTRAAVTRDLALVKVSATPASRPDIMQTVDVFRARVVDVAPDSLVIEITGTAGKIDGLLEVLHPYGVIEVARTGRVAMARGNAASPDAHTPPDETADDVTCSV